MKDGNESTVQSVSNQQGSPPAPQASLAQLQAYQDSFQSAEFSLEEAHQMVRMAAELGKSLELAQWLNPRVETKPLGVLAMASCLLDIQRPGLAQKFILNALTQLPVYVDLLSQFADYLTLNNEWRKAALLYESLTTYDPSDIQAHHRWRRAAYSAGDQKLHRYICQLAAQRFPDVAFFGLEEIRSRIYHPDETRGKIHEASLHWAETAFQKSTPCHLKTVVRRRPRIGFLGRFLHPMFLSPLLDYLDSSRFEVDLITNDPRASQISSGRIIPMPEGAFAETRDFLRARGYDVLIEMTGQYPELQLMAERIAPLQGSWICTNLTQGPYLSDFVIADPRLIPVSERHEWTEEIVDLPIWAPFRFHTHIPNDETPAFERNGHITFGACQRAMKFNVKTLAWWAEILNQTPKSRLLLKDKSFSDPMARRAMKERCGHAGLDITRVSFEGATPHPEYYEYYNRIDITLDTFPYAGGILTAESLWMGVPVITLEGDRFNSRLASSYLRAIQRPNWISQSPEHYIQSACELAASLDSIRAFRRSARTEMMDSAIMDYEGFARAFEERLGAMLRRIPSAH